MDRLCFIICSALGNCRGEPWGARGTRDSEAGIGGRSSPPIVAHRDRTGRRNQRWERRAVPAGYIRDRPRFRAKLSIMIQKRQGRWLINMQPIPVMSFPTSTSACPRARRGSAAKPPSAHRAGQELGASLRDRALLAACGGSPNPVNGFRPPAGLRSLAQRATACSVPRRARASSGTVAGAVRPARPFRPPPRQVPPAPPLAPPAMRGPCPLRRRRTVPGTISDRKPASAPPASRRAAPPLRCGPFGVQAAPRPVLRSPSRPGRSRAHQGPHPMPRLASAPAAARLALQAHVEELRAELASVLCPAERRQIERDLRTARAQLADLRSAC
ncbi:hypothetical protein Mnod_8277 (plasmid) [Methylobacterium nodulans ORS 2060]|uniref:Uncharacterized protein n=2 Tax=Methylobacterium nodulans TaxID=114616 RepID=B8IVI5_METNO|nr:hypothetical protein Mnod_8277 [Methylobacterium nodulans ORS 2060]